MAEPILAFCAELNRRQQLLGELEKQRAIRRRIRKRHRDLVEQAHICVARSHLLLERPVWTVHLRVSRGATVVCGALASRTIVGQED